MKVSRIFGFAPGDLDNNRPSLEMRDGSDDDSGIDMTMPTLGPNDPSLIYLDNGHGVRYILNLAHWALIEYHLVKE